jgi:Spy/CpxP family protein refolding chaperone
VKNLKVLALLGSLSLNAAFIVAWAAPALHAKRPEEPCGKGDGVGCPLYRQLEVSADQWKEIEPRLKAYQERTRGHCLCIHRAKNDLIDLVAADGTERAALEAKQKEILASHQKMQAELVDHLVAEKKVLSPAQQARLFGMLKGQGCRGCGPSGPDRGHSGSGRDR